MSNNIPPRTKGILDWMQNKIETNKRQTILEGAKQMDEAGEIAKEEIARTIIEYGIAGHTYVYGVLKDTEYVHKKRREEIKKGITEKEVVVDYSPLVDYTAPINMEEKNKAEKEVSKEATLALESGASRNKEQKKEIEVLTDGSVNNEDMKEDELNDVSMLSSLSKSSSSSEDNLKPVATAGKAGSMTLSLSPSMLNTKIASLIANASRTGQRCWVEYDEMSESMRKIETEAERRKKTK